MKFTGRTFGRREFIRLLGSSLLCLEGVIAFGGCRRRYERIPAQYNLGPVKDLLQPVQLVREQGMLVFRDERGWSAMSVQCTYEGCDLSYQEDVLVCLCCRSHFDLAGDVLEGPAQDKLPYYALRLNESILYADGEEIVTPEYRFTTPELEQAIQRFLIRSKREGIHGGAHIPDVLMGKGDGESGAMFKDKIDVGVTSSTLSYESSSE